MDINNKQENRSHQMEMHKVLQSRRLFEDQHRSACGLRCQQQWPSDCGHLLLRRTKTSSSLFVSPSQVSQTLLSIFFLNKKFSVPLNLQTMKKKPIHTPLAFFVFNNGGFPTRAGSHKSTLRFTVNGSLALWNHCYSRKVDKVPQL
jgi:hypothetical protein